MHAQRFRRSSILSVVLQEAALHGSRRKAIALKIKQKGAQWPVRKTKPNTQNTTSNQLGKRFQTAASKIDSSGVDFIMDVFEVF